MLPDLDEPGSFARASASRTMVLPGKLPKPRLVDRVYKGRKEIPGFEIKMTGSGKVHLAYKKTRTFTTYLLTLLKLYIQIRFNRIITFITNQIR
jgi:hypothetical protein